MSIVIKHEKLILRVALVGALLWFVVPSACEKVINSAWSVQQEEIARLSSPDSVVDAVLIRSNGGATGSFWYDVYIVARGEKPDLDKPDGDYGSHKSVFIASHLAGENIYWKEAKLLEIQYEQARIRHFRNYWEAKWPYVVEIRLVPLTTTFSLSPTDRGIGY